MRILTLIAAVLMLAGCQAEAEPGGKQAASGPSAASPAGPAAAKPAAAATPTPNLLTLAEGGMLLSAPNPGEALDVADGSPTSSWVNGGKRDMAPFVFVFELRGPTAVTAVGVTGAGKRPGGVQGASARDVVVEGSAEGPDKGFRRLAALTAAEEGETMAAAAPGAPVRWLRYTVSANHGSPVWTYVSELIARGSQPAFATVNFTGVYSMGRKDSVELKQQGTTLTGCYTEQSGNTVGVLRGEVDRGVARLAWTSDEGVIGVAMFALDSKGGLNGVKYRHKSRTAWTGPKAAAGVKTPCSQETPPANPIADALTRDGRALIYGILFDYDQAVLKPESTPALENLLGALKADAMLKLTIAGHTDWDGVDAYNLALSKRRAEAVVAWLVARGVDKARLTAVGKGESEPVASNDTADGRALNRRVEAVKS